MKYFILLVLLAMSCSMDVPEDDRQVLSVNTQTTFIGVSDISTVSSADPDCAKVGR